MLSSFNCPSLLEETKGCKEKGVTDSVGHGIEFAAIGKLLIEGDFDAGDAVGVGDVDDFEREIAELDGVEVVVLLLSEGLRFLGGGLVVVVGCIVVVLEVEMLIALLGVFLDKHPLVILLLGLILVGDGLG